MTHAPSDRFDPATATIAIVTYNRSGLLSGCLDGLAALEHRPDAVYVVDNASTDDTATVLAARVEAGDLPLHVITSAENLGGAGGFHLGLSTVYDAGWDRVWLMDDDVVPAPDCLTVMIAHPGPALIAVREDSRGRLCEKAATVFDLSNPRDHLFAVGGFQAVRTEPFDHHAGMEGH